MTMTMYKKFISIFLATAWIGASEFFRNEYLLKSAWEDHYKNLGLVFPSAPINGAIWGVWSLLLAVSIFILAKRFSLVQTALVAWLSAFVMMWVTIGNLGVMPAGLLWYAAPLSLLEVFLAAMIIKR